MPEHSDPAPSVESCSRTALGTVGVMHLAELASLFEAVARRMTESSWHRFSGREARVAELPTVGTTYAGWLLDDDKRSRDSDGLRPLGSVRHELREAVQAAPIESHERAALVLRFGLERMPIGRDSKHPTGAEILTTIGKPMTDRAFRDFVRQALEHVAPHIAPSSRKAPVAYGQVRDPRGAPWMQDPRPDIILAHAEARALELAAVWPVDDARRRLIEDEISLFMRLAEIEPDLSGRRDLHRARALISIGAWEYRFIRFRSPGVTPATVGLTVLRVENSPGTSESLDIEHRLEQIEAIERSGGDATPLLRESLGAVVQGGVSPDLSAASLAQASRLLRAREEWTVTSIANLMIREHPRDSRTLDCCMDAAMVAAPYGQTGYAQQFLSKGRGLIRTIKDQPQAPAHIERVEYSHVFDFAQSGLDRRMIESALLDPARAPLSVLTQADGHAQELLIAAPQLVAGAEHVLAQNTQADGGDAEYSWIARAALRHAELLQVSALIAFGRGDRSAGTRQTAAAGQRLVDVDNLLLASPAHWRYGFAPQRIKADIFQAVLEADVNAAVDAMARLTDGGWSVYRSVLPVQMVLREPSPRSNRMLPEGLRPSAEAAAEQGRVGAATPLDAVRRARVAGAARRVRRSRAGSTA